MKILAVDDDAFILELIPKIAAKVGCPDITTANSGAQALELLEESPIPFDCLLLDINMPSMDGIELCGRIRNMSAYRDTAIIMLTAMTDMDHLDRAFLAGASGYTVKPFDIIEFGDRLHIAQARIIAKRAGVQVTGVIGTSEPAHHSVEDWAAKRTVPLAGVTALIEYEALQNYLMRLTGPALTGAYVMAVTLSQILMQVAAAIDEVFSTSRYLMAYAGQGQFVLVSNAARLPVVGAVEAAIQDRLDGQRDEADGRSCPCATISAGSSIRPGGRGAQRARIAFESAINLAKDRAIVKQGAFRSGRVRFPGR